MAEPTTAEELPTLKVLLLGASGVGKSAIVMRYTENDFSDEAEATIGVDYRTKSTVSYTHLTLPTKRIV